MSQGRYTRLEYGVDGDHIDARFEDDDTQIGEDDALGNGKESNQASDEGGVLFEDPIQGIKHVKSRVNDAGGCSLKNLQQMDFDSDEPELSTRRYSSLGKYESLTLERSQFSRAMKNPFLLAMIGALVVAGMVIAFAAGLRGSTRDSLPTGWCESTPEWKGWYTIKQVFVFGDSWTDTSFDPEKAQPFPENPLGNPEFPGRSSANGTNWVGFITTKYNASFLQTYNLAVPGAATDNFTDQGYRWYMTNQVYKHFMGNYGDAQNPKWKGDDTLFAIWPGVVDLITMNEIRDADQLAYIHGNLSIVYSSILSALYGVGARNFLLLNEPPLHRTWHPDNAPKDIHEKFSGEIVAYNERVQVVAEGLKGKYADVNVFTFDTYTLLDKALDNPSAFPETSGIKNTTAPCTAYIDGTPQKDYFDPRCGIPVDQYFWLDGLHPTYPVHDLLAKELVERLESGPNVC